MSKYIADVSVPISQPLGEAAASSTSIGVDVDAGGTSGATDCSVSMVESWTASLASTDAGASDSRAARLPDVRGAVEVCSTAMVGLRGAPMVTRMVYRLASLFGVGLIMRLLSCVTKVHITLVAVSIQLEEVVSPIRHDPHLLAQPPC